MSKPNLAILVGTQGRGTNMRAIIEACQYQKIAANPKLVIAPKATTPAISIAQQLQVKTTILNPKETNYPQALLKSFTDHHIDIICLAGYMSLFPNEVIQKYQGRILNIHPALLPKFGGKGMYGIHVHTAVLAAKESVSGCTVHLVTENYDEGEPILQLKCKVLKSDTPESLAARVLEKEKIAYPRAIKRLIKQLRLV